MNVIEKWTEEERLKFVVQYWVPGCTYVSRLYNSVTADVQLKDNFLPWYKIISTTQENQKLKTNIFSNILL